MARDGPCIHFTGRSDHALLSENPRQLALGGVFAGLSVALHPRMVVVAGSVVCLEFSADLSGQSYWEFFPAY